MEKKGKNERSEKNSSPKNFRDGWRNVSMFPFTEIETFAWFFQRSSSLVIVLERGCELWWSDYFLLFLIPNCH